MVCILSGFLLLDKRETIHLLHNLILNLFNFSDNLPSNFDD